MLGCFDGTIRGHFGLSLYQSLCGSQRSLTKMFHWQRAAASAACVLPGCLFQQPCWCAPKQVQPEQPGALVHEASVRPLRYRINMAGLRLPQVHEY